MVAAGESLLAPAARWCSQPALPQQQLGTSIMSPTDPCETRRQQSWNSFPQQLTCMLASRPRILQVTGHPETCTRHSSSDRDESNAVSESEPRCATTFPDPPTRHAGRAGARCATRQAGDAPIPWPSRVQASPASDNPAGRVAAAPSKPAALELPSEPRAPKLTARPSPP